MGVGNPPNLDSRREEKLLVERMLAGDEEAFETFADGYFPGVYRFALARLNGNSELTREIVQTTMCKVLEKLESYRGDAALATWLCACCRNEIRMHFRRQNYAPAELELDEGIAADLAVSPNAAGDEGPERALIRKEKAHLVHFALDLLPPHYARALEWKYLDHLSVNEIAVRLEVGPKAAESLLTRARRAFVEHYERLTRDREPRAFAVLRGKGGSRP